MFDDSKTEPCTADTLGVGFIHSVEPLAKARKVLFLDTDARILDPEANTAFRSKTQDLCQYRDAFR